MFTLRIVRYDRNEQVLAECQSTALPARGESLQLDTTDAQGKPARPSTLWKVVAVTVHVPSLHSAAPADGGPLRVTLVDVAVVPDSVPIPGVTHSAQEILSESRM
jgi:hypothetical protein